MTMLTLLASAALSVEAARLNTVAERLMPAANVECVERALPPTCYGTIRLGKSAMMNAFADRGWIKVNIGLVRRTDDDELAFVTAHEMAHNILLHRTSSPRAEKEADALGTRIMMASGFDWEGGIRLVKRLTMTWIMGFPFSLFTHPITGERIKAIRDAAMPPQSAGVLPHIPQTPRTSR